MINMTIKEYIWQSVYASFDGCEWWNLNIYSEGVDKEEVVDDWHEISRKIYA